ncbi:MAG: G patch domain-containing protein 4, partial [Paramarteilia canceri]
EKILKSAEKSKAKIMMEKMGWEKGKGLGKTKNGRVDPISLANNRGVFGLGYKPWLQDTKY